MAPELSKCVALGFLTVRLPIAQWLPWPWKSCKLLDTKREGTEHKATCSTAPPSPKGATSPPPAVFGSNKVSLNPEPSG